MKGQTKLTIIAMLIGMFTVAAANAQDQGFIYGTVTTIDGSRYEGAIRWDDEEVYWSEMFNASKDENENLKYLSANERDYLESRSDNDSYVSSWVNITWSDDDDNDFVHQFAVPFGYISLLEPTGRNAVEITLRNGKKFRLDGSGYNDIGSEIQVADKEIGVIAIDWNRIDKVEFKETPRKLDREFGAPVSGTVTSDLGTFKGQIQWDHDERVGSDKLDGETRDGDVSVTFENIKSIERQGSRGSLVTLKSGRELELRGSNDVNDENRGIIVCVEGMGQIDLDWMDFDRVDFDSQPDSGPGYDSFAKIFKLEGSVETTEGTIHRGEMIFDLDEAYDSEVLQGNDDDSEYIIPFKYISMIKPKNWDYSTLKLKNGQEILLGDSQDVSDKNQGIIVFEKGEEVYIPWNKVKQVSF
jgi:hypothetical protein